MVFLAHVISKDGILLSCKDGNHFKVRKAKKCDRNQEFPLISWLFQQFIEPFSSIASPLKGLTRKNAKFMYIWMWKIFPEANRRLTTTLFFTNSDGTCGFDVYKNAYKEGLGCMIMKNGKMVAYGSRQWKEHKKNLPSHNLKLANVNFALKNMVTLPIQQEIWRFYQCKSLRYLFL